MKEVIADFLNEKLVIVKAEDGFMRACLPAKFEFGKNGVVHGGDYKKALSAFAADLAAHIENAKGGH